MPTTAPSGLSIAIVHLADRPQVIPTLERWFVAEWAPWYGPSGPGDEGYCGRGVGTALVAATIYGKNLE